jgi:hypothetical protein
MPHKFQITVMFDSVVPVDESLVIQQMLKAVATKEFMLPGNCKVYARELDSAKGSALHVQPLPPHVEPGPPAIDPIERHRQAQELLSPLPPPIPVETEPKSP